MRIIARSLIILGFYLFGGVALADCGESRFPSARAEGILPDQDTIKVLRDAERLANGNCASLQTDLARLYFWGDTEVTANLKRAYYHARLSLQNGEWNFDLHLYRAAFVIAGLDDSLSLAEAVRFFQREVNNENALRRDKALALLNQLARFQTQVRFNSSELLNAGWGGDRDNAGGGIALVSSRRGKQTALIFPDHIGSPQLAWSKAVLKPLSERRELIFQRQAVDALATSQDVRQRLWQLPKNVPASGVLLSRFILADGRPYESRCTASQVTAQWLISAAHCLIAPEAGAQLTAVDYLAQPHIDHHPNLLYAVSIKSIWLHREHRELDRQKGDVGRYSGSDIALLKLQKPEFLFEAAKLDTPLLPSGGWFDSFSYPDDQANNSLWLSRCRGTLWRQGKGNLNDVYALNCFSHQGQSGAAVLQRVEGQTRLVGIISARIYNEQINQPVFTAISRPLLAEIQLLLKNESIGLNLFKRLGVVYQQAKLQ